MSANDIQVGGSHYRTAGNTQHWDWVTQNHLPYLEAVATKYVCRWRKKNGRQDLEKAAHYVAKLMEQFQLGICKPQPDRAVNMTVTDFATANHLGVDESAFCRILLYWQTKRDLLRAMNIVQRLIAEA